MRVKTKDGDRIMTAQEMIFLAAIAKAATGDLRAIKYVNELIATARREHYELHRSGFGIIEQLERHVLTDSPKRPPGKRSRC